MTMPPETKAQEVHKLVIRPRSAKLACGPSVSAYYPQSNRADEYMVVTGDEGVTCEKCAAAILKAKAKA